MTMNMFHSYQLHERSNSYSLLMRTGRLFQQYVVTAYCSIELDRIDYIRRKQQDIRNDYLAGLYDAIDRGDQCGSDVGTRTILPASFTGGLRYMYSQWAEVRRFMESYPLLTTADRADMVVRIFYLKVKQFISYLKDARPLGTEKGALGTIEFQKRGLPHCHTLGAVWFVGFHGISWDLYLKSHEMICLKFLEILQIIDSTKYMIGFAIDPCGYKVATETMIHGPCGLANTSAPCMEDFKCSKKFPKPYNEETFFDKQGFVHYRQRSTRICKGKIDADLDNGYHMLIKYLFKYISKGTDRVAVQISRSVPNFPDAAGSSKAPSLVHVDEIKNFVDARFICPYEACWRIFNFPIHFREPAVQVLAVHLPNMQVVTFHSAQSLRSIVNDPDRKRTTLTEWLA
ncbi:uncharacterized protein [Rutidosis leptorrhynchoides]|uniref:uncharacterized protein n=1 Tax=Rutidosis leptorrhynchoides TaxID=125765 RepID=UPI003A9A1122